MSSAEYIEQKKKLIASSFSVCVSKVVKILQQDCSIKICLYEGLDDKLYYSRFYSNDVCNNHAFVDCNGKENVIKTIKALCADKSILDFDGGQLVAFVDRDFDDIPKNKMNNVYKTPCYSIENFCCNKNAFEYFLKMELGLQKLDPDDKKKINRLVKLYYKKFETDLQKIKELNSWGLYQRNHGMGYSCCHFNNVNIKTICSKRNCWAFLETAFPSLPKVSEGKKRLLRTNSIHRNPVERYRGKWVFALYAKIMQKLIEDTNGNKNNQLINTKPRLNDTTFSSLVKYAECPESLMTFLKKYGWA